MGILFSEFRVYGVIGVSSRIYSTYRVKRAYRTYMVCRVIEVMGFVRFRVLG